MAPNNQDRNTVSSDSCYDAVCEIKKTLHDNDNVELTGFTMSAHVARNPFMHHDKMAIKAEVPNEVISDYIEKNYVPPDELDKPSYNHVERGLSDENARNQELFDVMKYEENRLNSFTGKWPLCYIKPKDLAEEGFFYLQSEDKVQCAFCSVIIDDWNVGDKPVKKHMLKSPKCVFLRTTDTGNVPIAQPKPVAKNVKKCLPNTNTRNTFSNQPKYPKMSDVRNRLLSYRDWPHLMLSSRQLAESGLFYTGKEDFVTCFYCGGSLGNWELNDDPLVEHEKFFPDCGYLDLVKTRKAKPSFSPVNNVSAKFNIASSRPSAVSANSLPNQIIKEAYEIFPDHQVVNTVAIQHFQKTHTHFTSLDALCEAVIQYEEKKRSASTMSPSNNSYKTVSGDVTSKKAPADNTNSELNCQICMEEVKNIVFEPCHHQYTCEKCAQKVTKCPLCRTVITNRIKVFWG